MSTIFRPYSESEALRSDRSAGDRKRHREKLRRSIRENIADVIAEESIIGRDRDRVIKVPIRGVKEYRFVFGDNAGGVGTGDGNTEPGQVVGSARGKGDKGQGPAGSDPGLDYYETEITLDELIDIMFEDLELPDLERKILKQATAERVAKRQGYRKAGIRVHLDRRRTVKAKLRRKIASGVPLCSRAEEPEAEDDGLVKFPFRKEDLTYKRLVLDEREESNAVVICIMDTSGSMDRLKKYLARSFFFLLYQFLCTKYKAVEIVFIAHHTQAKEVTEEEFFHKGESGGTLISSGYRKALDVIQAALPSGALERLRLPLLGRRQLRIRQRGGAQGRARAVRDLQPVRLWRDQADGLALLRELDARALPPPRRRELPVGPDRAPRGHLALVQGVPVARPGDGGG